MQIWRRPIAWWVVAGFVLLHAALFWLDLYPAARRHFGDEVMYRALAERTARGDLAFPELLWPPLYGWMLAPFVWAGTGWPHLAAFAQVLLLGLSSCVFADLLTRLTGSERVATLGQALMLLDPHFAAYAHYLWPEVVYIAEVLLLFWLAVVRPGGHLWWVVSGVLMAASVATKSVLAPYAPLLVVPLAIEIGWRRALWRVAGTGVIAAVLLLPLALRNWNAEGAFVVSDSSRFNLWVGLTAGGRRSAVSDNAGPEFVAFEASAPTFAGRQAALSRRLSTLVREHGAFRLLARQWPRQYFRLFDRRTFLTEQFAGGPFQERHVGYVEPAPVLSALLAAWNALFYAAVLAAAGVGLFTADLRRRPWLAVLLGVLAYSLCLFYVVEARSRFRLPLMLSLWTAAACALAGGTPRAPRWQFVAGLVTSAVLLVFAFGAELVP